MFNNTALDVVIGLVLVYLLYSLLITIFGELIATWFGMRARILRIAIERMLNDGLDVKVSQGKLEIFGSLLSRMFLKEPPIFKNSFAGLFYNYPSIKYLAKLEPAQAFIFGQTKPSYITPDNFAVTVINILCEHGAGDTKSDQLLFSLKNNTLFIEPETIKQLRNIYNHSGNDLNRFKDGLIAWYNETMDRANGWYKRKITFILFWLGFLLAFSFNLDSIKIAHILSKDKEARSQLVNMGIALSKDSTRYKTFLHSGKDTVTAQALIDSGFAHVSNDIGSANLILGLGWQFSALKKDSSLLKDLRYYTYYKQFKKSIDSAGKYIQTVSQHLAKQQDSITLLNTQIKRLAQDTLLKKKQLGYVSGQAQAMLKDAISKDINSISDSYMMLFNIQSVIKKESDNVIQQTKTLDAIRDTVNKKEREKYTSLTAIKFNDKNKTALIVGSRHLSFGEKTRLFLYTGFFSRSFWGFMITGFALSLGAPFWFGLLNKLISLRASGVKPKDNDLVDDSSSKTNGANTKSLLVTTTKLLNTDPLTTAIEELSFRYKDCSGVISIGSGFKKIGQQKVRAVEIHVIKDVFNVIKVKIGEAYHNVPVNIMINTIIEAHLAGGDLIENDGFGTLGCFVKNRENGKTYLMSCWHVLKQKNDQILYSEDPVASVFEGGITSNMDIGFAELTPNVPVSNQSIGIKDYYRTVTQDDAEAETGVTFYGGTSKKQVTGVKIYNNAPDTQKIYHAYSGNYHLMSDLFSITRYDHNGSPTSPSDRGDSGAVVVDVNGHPLGVVVGGDASFTYAVKLSNVFADKNYKKYSIPII